MQHAYPESKCLGRVECCEAFAVKKDLSLRRLTVTGKQPHQGALSSAVFSQQTIDPPGLQNEIDVLVRPHCTIVLVDISKFDAHDYLALLAPSMPCSSCGMYQICLSMATSPGLRNTLPS